MSRFCPRILCAALSATCLFSALVAQGAEPTEKRPLPDYDGRGPAPSTPGQKALWIPRVTVSPLYVVSEYVVRRPLGVLVTTAERDHWPTAILNFFTFGEDQKMGLIPTALLDFGFKPCVGLYYFWDDALAKGNAVRVHASTWGPDWLAGSVADRIALLGDDASLAIRFEGTRRPDQVHHGLGPRATSERARYSVGRLDGSLLFSIRGWRSSSLRTWVGLRDVHFEDKGCCHDPTIGERVAAGAYPWPEGFQSGYSISYQRVEAALDTRQRRPANGTGARLELEGEQGTSLPGTAEGHWFRYGGTAVGFLDLTGRWRVLSLSVNAAFADPVRSGGAVPFTEQVLLGGSGPMRGYLLGHLKGRSALVATLQYQWPIWVWLDGVLQAAVGNVFGEHLKDLEPSLFRLSGTLGLRTVGSPDHSFEILGGFGTDTFKDGTKVSSARIVFGASKGF